MIDMILFGVFPYVAVALAVAVGFTATALIVIPTRRSHRSFGEQSPVLGLGPLALCHSAGVAGPSSGLPLPQFLGGVAGCAGAALSA